MPVTWCSARPRPSPRSSIAELYDINVLSTQRVNRAALPQLRKQGAGLLVWVSSSSAAAARRPHLAPYFAAKAAMDALAVSYAGELARWGIETSIVVPGAFTKGTNHFAHSGKPADQARAEHTPTARPPDLPEIAMKGLAALEPRGRRCRGGRRGDRPGGECAVRQAAVPRPHRPPSQDGAEIVNGVADRVRAELLRAHQARGPS